MKGYFSGSNTSAEKIWFIVVFVVSFFPKILSSIYGVTDSFTYSAVAVSQVSADTGHVQFHPFLGQGDFQQHANFISERAAVTSLLVTIHLVTGVPIADMRFLPINSIVLIPLSYALAKLLTGSRLAAGLYVMFLAYDPSINALTYNVFYIGLGISLFFMFVVIYVKILDSDEFRVNGIVLLILTFIATYLTYYVTELEEIVFSFAIAVITLIALRFGMSGISRRPLLWLTAAFLTILTAFDSIVYTFLPVYARSSIILGTLSRYWGYVKALLLQENLTSISTQQFEAFTTYIGLMLWVSIVLPTLVYLAYLLVNFVRISGGTTARVIDHRHIVALALLLAFFGVIFVYAGVSAFPFKDALLVFSLISFLAIGKTWTRKRKDGVRVLRAALLCIVVVLAVAKFGAWFTDPIYGYTTGAKGPVCMVSFIDQGSVLTDLRTGGVLLTNLAELHRADSVNVYTFSDSDSEWLYSQNQEKVAESFSAHSYNYLILQYSSATQVFSGVSWVAFTPLGTAFQAPMNYSIFGKICSDSRMVVYRYTP